MGELLLLISIVTIFISTTFKVFVFRNKNIHFFSLLMLRVVEAIILVLVLIVELRRSKK
jgi:hypothetical protein